MIYSDEQLSLDIEKVRQIPIVTRMLDVICEATGMGFAAIARVTQDRWIVCSVRDEINFGLKPGGELKIETTICNEIRDQGTPVIIDHVDESDQFRHHHTPLMYGFQSYISFPIILKTGEFFGTLCAIDPRPALLNNSKTIGMFEMFSELISFHLQNSDLLERSHFALKDLKRELANSEDENRQFRYISNHNLQEPLRKIRVFSDMLVNTTEESDVIKSKDLALKINHSVQRFSMMIKDLSDFSEMDHQEDAFEEVDLSKVIADVQSQLSSICAEKQAVFYADNLMTITAIPVQIERVFYNVINNALKYSKPEVNPVIKISQRELDQEEVEYLLPGKRNNRYVEIKIEDNGKGIDELQLRKIFDIFTHLPSVHQTPGNGIGLAYCRKIIHNHRGSIEVKSEVDQGSVFSIILPV